MSKLLKELKQGFMVDHFDRKPIMGVLAYSKEYTPGAEILPRIWQEKKNETCRTS